MYRNGEETSKWVKMNKVACCAYIKQQHILIQMDDKKKERNLRSFFYCFNFKI